MSTRSRHIAFLVLAIVVFGGVVFGIVSSMTARRARRDLTFGIEELDVLIADGAYREAGSMIPRLADRAITAGDGMRVLARAYTLFVEKGLTEPLDRAADRLLEEFPANTGIRSVAVYAAVRAGREAEALEMATGRLGTEGATVYAWTVLSNAAARDSPQYTQEGDPSGDMLLAGLTAASSAEEFERAWRLTGDERYALNAVLLRLRDDGAAALELAEAISLRVNRPLLVADIMVDRGRFDDAIGILSSLDQTEPHVRLRLADALVYAGDDPRAIDIYERFVAGDATGHGSSRPPYESLLNLAWLERERAPALVTRARALFPDTWPVVRAYAAVKADGSPDVPAPVHSIWLDTPHEADARLLSLQMDPHPDRHGYDGDLWLLLELQPSDEAFRYAAWYFFTRGQIADLELVLRRAASLHGLERPEPSWSRAYRGLVSADQGQWEAAAEHFASSFAQSPSWQAALNAAIALLHAGRTAEASTRLRNALLLARHGTGRERTRVFLVAARLEARPEERHRLVAEALAIDPASSEALVLAAQLDNPRAR